MAEKKTGRKKDFPGEDTERLQIILPKDTLTELAVFIAKSGDSRNQLINRAVRKYIKDHDGIDS